MLCLQQGNGGYDNRCDSACNKLFNKEVHRVASHVSRELLKVDYCLRVGVLVREPQEIVEKQHFY